MNQLSNLASINSIVEARYLTAFKGPNQELEDKLHLLMEVLEADYEEVRVNPVENRKELEASVSSNFEYTLLIHWKPNISESVLINFDVQMFTPVEPYHLNEALAAPASAYFVEPILVYNSLGRDRTVQLFPHLLDFENVVRELIISVMFKYFGPKWWDEIMVIDDLSHIAQDAEKGRQLEENGKLHDSLPMHLLYYTDLKDLRQIMEKADEIMEENLRAIMPNPTNLRRNERKKWEKELTSKLPFASVLENYDQVSMAAKISEIRELRNRIMHGRYLTNMNEQAIRLVCEQYHRFLIESGHVGKFESRPLA